MPKLNAGFDRKEIHQTFIDNGYCQIYIERVFRIMHKRMGGSFVIPPEEPIRKENENI